MLIIKYQIVRDSTAVFWDDRELKRCLLGFIGLQGAAHYSYCGELSSVSER
jgi:hypothetical protein